MISRAERAVLIESRLAVEKRVKRMCETVCFSYGIEFPKDCGYVRRVGGIPTQHTELLDELVNLKRNMGMSERREYERLLKGIQN